MFGGRGAPYHFGSAIKPGFDRDDRVFAALRATLVDLFPVLATARDHPRVGRRRSAIPRDWCASVGLDRATGLGWAGGYVGDGVEHHQPGRPHAARPGPARRDTDLTRLPWVGHRSRKLGARAAALARRQRRPAGDAARRRRGGRHRPPERGGASDVAAAGWPLRCAARSARARRPVVVVAGGPRAAVARGSCRRTSRRPGRRRRGGRRGRPARRHARARPSRPATTSRSGSTPGLGRRSPRLTTAECTGG